MPLPNYLWPRELTPADGFNVRLGRVVHWILAVSGGLMIAIAIVMAAVALLSAEAWAQQSRTSNATEQSQHGQVKPFDGNQSGAAAYGVQLAPDLQPFTPAGPGGFDPPRKSINWNLLQISLGMLFGGAVLLLLGRALRYVLANE